MTPKLSNEQRQAIEAQPGGPVFVVDDETQQLYVLLPAEAYQKIQSLIGGDSFDIRETYSLQDRLAAAAGWDDPAMDDYNAHGKNQ